MWLRRAGLAALATLAPCRCAGCGDSGSALCEGCTVAIESTAQPILVGARAAFAYGDEVRAVLHEGKFRDGRSALRALAWLGAARLSPPAGAVVVPVPLSARRLAERGYNQAELVARAFAGFHRLPVRGLLRRTRDTAPQTSRDRPARQANVAGAFSATAGSVGATAWLVDDVLTTGATTAAARDALLAAGAVRVDVAVLAAVL